MAHTTKRSLLGLQTRVGFFGVKFPYGMKEAFMKEMESSLQTEIITLSDAKKIRQKMTQFLALKRLSNGSITRVRDIFFEDPPTP